MNGFYITKDSSNLVQIWNCKPKKIRVNQNDFIFGRTDEIGIDVSNNNFFRNSLPKGVIKFINWTNNESIYR
jgi:hypothetical protein